MLSAFSLPHDSRQAQQALDPPSVESDHGFAINDGHRRCPVPKRLKLGQRLGIFSDVLLSECDPFVRKKLFLCLATGSAWLGVDDDLFRHHASPF